MTGPGAPTRGRSHLLEFVARQDGTIGTYLNGRAIKARWVNIHTSVKSRRTEVVMEVLQEPFVVWRGDVKSWTWALAPCRVIGELPAEMFR